MMCCIIAGVDCPSAVYRLLVGVWIFFGLAWLAGVLEIMQEKLQSIVISIESRLSPPAAGNVDNHQVGGYRETKLGTFQVCKELNPGFESGCEKQYLTVYSSTWESTAFC